MLPTINNNNVDKARAISAVGKKPAVKSYVSTALLITGVVVLALMISTTFGISSGEEVIYSTVCGGAIATAFFAGAFYSRHREGLGKPIRLYFNPIDAIYVPGVLVPKHGCFAYVKASE